MAIPVANIHEGCCDTFLNQFTILDGDSLDSVGSTCDKIIECSDKYYLIEEKSIIFAFFNNCGLEVGIDINLDENYRCINNEIDYINISNIITNIVQPMDEEIKKRILAETLSKLIMTSAKKASNTTDILNKRFDNNKTNNMSIFYLYCNSGKPIDRIINTWLSRYKKNMFIECNILKQKLEQECI